MEGGEISGNLFEGANGEMDPNLTGGGGVCVWGAGSSFTMKGGIIYGNTVEGGGGGSFVSGGGGVCVFMRGAFTMEGGTINGNAAGTDTATPNSVIGATAIGAALAVYGSVYNGETRTDMAGSAKWGASAHGSIGGATSGCTPGGDIIGTPVTDPSQWYPSGPHMSVNDTIMVAP
jgi:hypothetical protein